MTTTCVVRVLQGAVSVSASVCAGVSVPVSVGVGVVRLSVCSRRVCVCVCVRVCVCVCVVAPVAVRTDTVLCDVPLPVLDLCASLCRYEALGQGADMGLIVLACVQAWRRVGHACVSTCGRVRVPSHSTARLT